MFNHYCDDDDEEYANFVKSLGLVEQSDDATSFLPGQGDNRTGDVDNVADEEDEYEDDFFVSSHEDDDDNDEGGDNDDDDDDVVQVESLYTSAKTGSRRSVPSPYHGHSTMKSAKKSSVSNPAEIHWDVEGFDPNFYEELEDELGGLEEEDLEAAVASLLGTTSTTFAHSQKYDANMDDANGIQDVETINSCLKLNTENSATSTSRPKNKTDTETNDKWDYHVGSGSHAPTTPLRTVTGMRTQAAIMRQQVHRLQELLNRHYQVLIQQSVLCIHTASTNGAKRAMNKKDLMARGSYDEIAQILDASIGMLKDLDQVCKTFSLPVE